VKIAAASFKRMVVPPDRTSARYFCRAPSVNAAGYTLS
jgi:hypothetical protein